jgi:hypothetical protein
MIDPILLGGGKHLPGRRRAHAIEPHRQPADNDRRDPGDLPDGQRLSLTAR